MGTLYLAAFLVACVTSFSMTPLAIWLAKRYGVMDQPDPRKVHSTPMPRWGGLAIYGGVFFSVFGVYAGFPRFRELLNYRHSLYDGGRLLQIVTLDSQLAGILVGFTAVVI